MSVTVENKCLANVKKKRIFEKYPKQTILEHGEKKSPGVKE